MLESAAERPRGADRHPPATNLSAVRTCALAVALAAGAGLATGFPVAGPGLFGGMVAAQQTADAEASDSVLVPPGPQSPSDSAASPGPAGAFLRGVLVPGWGHAASDATTRGVFYFGAESLAGWMLYKTARRLGTAREQAALWEERVGQALTAQGVSDAAELEAELEADDDVARARGLVSAREEQREDWLAVVIFTLLVSGLDAFVSAHLQEFPEPLTIEGDPATGRVEVGFRVPATPRRVRPTPATRGAPASPTRRW